MNIVKWLLIVFVLLIVYLYVANVGFHKLLTECVIKNNEQLCGKMQ